MLCLQAEAMHAAHDVQSTQEANLLWDYALTLESSMVMHHFGGCLAVYLLSDLPSSSTKAPSLITYVTEPCRVRLQGRALA